MILARAELLAGIVDSLERGHNVLLHGPPQIGKTAVISALPRHLTSQAIVIDPFEHFSPRAAAEVRRSMDLRGQQYVAATRSLDRDHMGAVRRIAWRFTAIRVPPLSRPALKRLILAKVAAMRATDGAGEMDGKLAGQLAARCLGRPGLALAMAGSVVELRLMKGYWPSTEAAYIHARIHEWERESRRASR